MSGPQDVFQAKNPVPVPTKDLWGPAHSHFDLGEDIYLSIKYYIAKGFPDHQSQEPANYDQKFVITHKETA